MKEEDSTQRDIYLSMRCAKDEKGVFLCGIGQVANLSVLMSNIPQVLAHVRNSVPDWRGQQLLVRRPD